MCESVVGGNDRADAQMTGSDTEASEHVRQVSMVIMCSIRDSIELAIRERSSQQHQRTSSSIVIEMTITQPCVDRSIPHVVKNRDSAVMPIHGVRGVHSFETRNTEWQTSATTMLQRQRSRRPSSMIAIA